MILTFDSKKDGEDKLQRVLKVDQAFGVLWDLQQEFWKVLKYGPERTTEEWQKYLIDLLNDENIDLDRDYP